MKKFFLIIFISVLFLSACSCKQEEPAEQKPEADIELYEEYKDLEGKWRGQWKNTTFESSGDARAFVEINKDGTASFTIDLDGLVFGMVDPDPKKFTSAYTEKGIAFRRSDSLFGDLAVIIDKTGEKQADIIVDAENILLPAVASMNAKGSLSKEKVHLDYVVNFSPSGIAKGVLDLEKIK